ncbi:MAG TPA: cyclase family protein [Bryobacteraceae bacterium]|nr:cyclase family protein [Bryobacteraceae bacterium]
MMSIPAPRLSWIITLVAVAIVPVQAQQNVDKATLDKWMKELSNWGRWGAQDQLGAVNLITPEVRRRAAALVKEGFSVSLSRDADAIPAVDNGRPFGHKMISTGVDPKPMFTMDTYIMSHHGASLTHMDALSHMVYEGKLYNGYSQDQVNDTGAHQLAVDAYKSGLFSRGILMDIPRLKGLKYLEISTPIYASDLDAWEKKAGLKVRSGDVVFIRTGRWARRAEKGPWQTDKASAGLHVSAVRWLKQRDVAVLGSDVHAELMPSPVPGVEFPVHQLVLIAMGVPMLDNCDLEALSEAAAARRRWQFLFTAAPLSVPRGTGSALNPIATF